MIKDNILLQKPEQWERNSDGVIKAFEDGELTVEKMLDYADLELDWYTPSDYAIEFITFIRLVLGEEPENTNPKAHYFFIDCVFQQPNVDRYFQERGIDVDAYRGTRARTVILASREFAKALSWDTKIATPTGPKLMEDIQKGDYVVRRTGKPTKVISKSKKFMEKM